MEGLSRAQTAEEWIHAADLDPKKWSLANLNGNVNVVTGGSGFYP